MNRGSPAGQRRAAHAAFASMRPRFMNRGSMDKIAGQREAVRCFNEAPIHESGKYRAASLLARQSRRFNEAPIHESGKSR